MVDATVVGANEIAMLSSEMVPAVKRLSVRVGMVSDSAGDSVPNVRSTGPMLFLNNMSGMNGTGTTMALILNEPENTVNTVEPR